MRIGANYLGDGKCEFVVWAPFLKKVELKIVAPRSCEKIITMQKDKLGYWRVIADGVFPGTKYFYRLEENRERTDPAANFQPDGVHGPSGVIDHSLFKWEDKNWKCMNLSEMIIYEIHTGTFTPAGTFSSIIPRLGELKEFGINTIEIMPVAQFPGERNWGYDGVYPFAVQNSYGGPDGLKKLVNECHKKGMAVILDVVYNHLGPEGNYIWDFAPYFTKKYRGLWGDAINFDDLCNEGVRNYFIENALYWFRNYHIDGLRLDAIHGIFDKSDKTFLQELAEKVEKFSKQENRKYYLIAESDLNNSRVIRPRSSGGYGIDAQWCDDFHHCVHTLLTEEKQGYYLDFGRIEQLVKSLKEGYVYSGQYSEYRKRKHGNSSKDRPATQFVVFSQNHDQVGNRALSERLSSLVSFDGLKLAAGIVILSPYIPLLFMGEEYGEDVPFFYFVSHSDKNLIESVRRGRKEEFKAFNWKGEPPDPQSEETFFKSKIKWEKRKTGKHKILLNFYKNLIRMRKEIPALSNPDNKKSLEVKALKDKKVLFIKRQKKENQVFGIFNFNKKDVNLAGSIPRGISHWKKLLDSSDKKWGGSGTLLPEIIRGHSFVVYGK